MMTGAKVENGRSADGDSVFQVDPKFDENRSIPVAYGFWSPIAVATQPDGFDPFNSMP